MTDTGCFRYSNTDNKCHEIAIECLNNGIETHKVYQHIYENSTRSRIELMGNFLSISIMNWMETGLVCYLKRYAKKCERK